MRHARLGCARLSCARGRCIRPRRPRRGKVRSVRASCGPLGYPRCPHRVGVEPCRRVGSSRRRRRSRSTRRLPSIDRAGPPFRPGRPRLDIRHRLSIRQRLARHPPLPPPPLRHPTLRRPTLRRPGLRLGLGRGCLLQPPPRASRPPSCRSRPACSPCLAAAPSRVLRGWGTCAIRTPTCSATA
ncbi:MAG: hypothetical protein RL033_7571 [Pseudomonadota bacterium]